MFDLQLIPSEGDCFKGNLISITGAVSGVTFMSGPILRSLFSPVAVGTVWEKQTVEEVLFYEFSHYFRITLEGNPTVGDLNALKRRLHRQGFSEQYLLL